MDNALQDRLGDFEEDRRRDRDAIDKQLLDFAGRLGKIEQGVSQIQQRLSAIEAATKNSAADTQKAVNEVKKVIAGGES